jgi:hypothetical protein
MDQTTLLLAMAAAIFLAGVMCGYGTRAAISQHRRRRYGKT